MEIFPKKDKDELSMDDVVFVGEYEMKGRIVEIHEDTENADNTVYDVKLNNGETRHFTAESLSEAK